MDIFEQELELNNGNEPALEDMNREVPADGVAELFAGAAVLVTGGTGFVGKALLEKLLRCCPALDTVYVLVRPKRGLSVERRHRELLDNPVFERVRARLHKLVPLAGDVAAPALGLAAAARAQLARVRVVFHAAATVRFTDPLATAAALNVHGTAALLALARDMPQLRALVHVSTAYSNAPLAHVQERVYPPPVEPEVLLRCAKLLPPSALEALAAALLASTGHPNPYTLTKALAESVVHAHDDLPVCIVRPSIVTAAYQEPFPGWIDNVYGVTGIIMEIGRGTYRSGLCRERCVVDLVPVDTLVNCCVLAAWRQATRRPRCPVYHVTSGALHPLQWGRFTRLCLRWAREHPSKYVMWYPNFSFTESRPLNTFWELSCHFLPAFVTDLVLRAQGRKPVMMKMARRFKMAAATGEYFAAREWRFDVDELLALRAEAEAATDGALFAVWPAAFSWDSYVGAYMLGIRRFILKDGAESLPAARRRLARLRLLYRALQLAAAAGLARLLLRLPLRLPLPPLLR